MNFAEALEEAVTETMEKLNTLIATEFAKLIKANITAERNAHRRARYAQRKLAELVPDAKPAANAKGGRL